MVLMTTALRRPGAACMRIEHPSRSAASPSSSYSPGRRHRAVGRSVTTTLLLVRHLVLLFLLATAATSFLVAPPRLQQHHKDTFQIISLCSRGGGVLSSNRRVAVKMGAFWSSDAVTTKFLSGKVVWITGASSGLGKALALQCARGGATVVLSARNVARLEQVQQECLAVISRGGKEGSSGGGGRVVVYGLDMEDGEARFAAVAREVAEKLGGIDILINNAGVSTRSLAEETSMEVDAKVMAINFFGPVALTKAVLPYLRKSRKGHVIVINSVQGKVGLPSRTSYSASKHALTGYFDSLRAELSVSGIGVTAIFPGYIKTSLSLNALTGQGQAYGKMDDTTSKGMDPDDLACRILKAAARGKQEVVYAAVDARAAILFRSLLPDLLFWILAKKAKKAAAAIQGKED